MLADDHIIRCLVGDPLVRVVAAVTTEASREAARRHGAVAGAEVALGRSVTAGLLLATLTKGNERVTLQVSGDGPFGDIVVDAHGNGDVRAYVQNPGELVAAGTETRASVARGVGGRGTVSVLRDVNLKERFTGQAPIISGEIDADVEHYLRTSEQIESAVGCDVVLESTTEIAATAGVLAQCMPGEAGLPVVRELRHKFRNGLLFGLVRDLPTAEDIARALLGELADGLEVLDIRSLRFSCPCSPERVAGALEMVSAETMERMIEEDGGAEVTCNFCRQCYDVSKEALRELLEKRAISF